MTTALDLPTMPPCDGEAERAILGAILLYPHVMTTVGEILTESDFYDAPHRLVFAAMLRLENAGRPIDHITVSEELKQAGCLQEVGGSAGVAELIQAVPSAANVTTHCLVVQDKAKRRHLRRIGYELCTQAYDEQESLPVVVERAEQAILALEHEGTMEAPLSTTELVNDRVAHLETLYKQKKLITGIPTGLASLDDLTAGLQPGNLDVIAGRPSMGKTGLALTIAANVALNEQKPVQIFSLEMTKEELTDRLLSLTAKVDLKDMKTGQISSADWFRIAQAAEQLSNAPLHIDDRATVTLPQLRRRARRAKAKTGMALMIVDYLQLMTPTTRGESRQQEISDISRGLKLLAKELAVPIVALAQLNRKVEDRSDQRPLLADLRDSGAIEQDADVVAFIYRDEVYHKDTEDRGIAEILIRKHRNGPTGERRLVFLERYAKFCELDSVHQ
jgi:replicative DNA helicase